MSCRAEIRSLKPEGRLKADEAGVKEPADWYLSVMAVLLFLAGGTMLFTKVSSTIAFAVIAIAGALSLIAFSGRPHGGGAP
jgi:hypothetical protein